MAELGHRKTNESETVANSVVGQIIDWSWAQPLWVQGALRRIILNTLLTKMRPQRLLLNIDVRAIFILHNSEVSNNSNEPEMRREAIYA